MIKKTIKYTDFLGTERTDVFYFHLSKPELTEWLTTTSDYTFDKVLEKYVKDHNYQDLFKFFKDLIQRSVGEVSLDGRRFVKNQEITDAFMQSEAYSVLFDELSLDDNAAFEFMKGIMPSDVSKEISSLDELTSSGLGIQSPSLSMKKAIPTNGSPTSFAMPD